MNFEEAKVALESGAHVVEVEIEQFTPEQREEFFRLLEINAKSLAKVFLVFQSLFRTHEKFNDNDDAKRLEKIFAESKTLFEVSPTTDKLKALTDSNMGAIINTINFIERYLFNTPLTDVARTNYEGVRDRLPGIKAIVRTILLDERVDQIGSILERMNPLAAELGVNLTEFTKSGLTMPPTIPWLVPVEREKPEPKSIKPEAIKTEAKQKPLISPREIREKLKAKSGVTLGLVEIGEEGRRR